MTNSPLKDFFLNINSRFKYYDFDTIFDILLAQSQKEAKSSKKPVIYIIAGPNGSGKSTLVTNFINYQIFGDKFVNAGIYAQTKFKDVEDPNERERLSMLYAADEFNRLVGENRTFIFETVLSHESKLDMIKKAKKKGYRIVSIYVFTDFPEINVDRVNKRTAQGAVGVEENKVRARYIRSLENATELKALSDEYYQMNNTRERG